MPPATQPGRTDNTNPDPSPHFFTRVQKGHTSCIITSTNRYTKYYGEHMTPTNDPHNTEHHEHTPPSIASACITCGAPIEYKGRGRRPHYCSSACRHTAWARRQAAAEGLIASRVIELPSPAVQHYDDESVARWLARDEKRIMRVARAMRSTRTLGIMGTHQALARALDTVRDYVGSPQEPATKLEKHLAEKLAELEAHGHHCHHNDAQHDTATPAPHAAQSSERTTTVPPATARTAKQPRDDRAQKRSATKPSHTPTIHGTRGTKRVTLSGEHLRDGEQPADANTVVLVEYHHPSGTHLVDEQWSDQECEDYVRSLTGEVFFF